MKNIVLASDGTGKRGGVLGHDTNVFRMYRSVDLQDDNQLVCYDDGIGAYGNKWLKIIVSTVGFGFSNKIITLYKYLAKNYEPGDKVFLFGFSRGAATIRALAGLIDAVGLLRNDHSDVTHHGVIDDLKLHIEAYKALWAFKRIEKKPEYAAKYKERKTHGSIDIEMVGVWDTVSAFGFPQDSTYLLIGFSKLVQKAVRAIIPCRFDYQLSDNVKHAYHALSIDDNRHTFFPTLWDETARKRPEHIEQVWFAGDHGNVGGGRARVGLSNISLDWMMCKAESHGLKFDYDAHPEVKRDSNRAGLQNDPRAGLGVYYRIGHRHIRDLTKGKLRGNIKIHKSVVDRIKTTEYHPILPNKFDIVDNCGEVISTFEDSSVITSRLKSRVNKLLAAQVWMYHFWAEFTVGALVASLYFDRYVEPVEDRSEFFNSLVSFAPSFMENFLFYLTYQNPLYGAAIMSVVFFAVIARLAVKKWIIRIRNEINSRQLRNKL